MRKGILKAGRDERGYGLFGVFKRDTTTPFQYLAGIVMGLSAVLLGIEMIWLHIHKGHDPLWSLGDAIVVIAAGMFVAHAGAIYWFQRLFIKGSRARKMD